MLLTTNVQKPADGALTVDGTVKLLQIEPTTRCNFTCGFCYGRSMDQNDMEIEVFEMAYARFPGLQRMELHGEGEPMLSPHFFEMAKKASSNGVVVSAITNGSMFSTTRIKSLLDSGIQTLFVSIESPRAAEFKKIRGGSLARVKRGIRALLRARDARGQSTPGVGLSVTVLKSTQEQLREIADLYLELGMDGGISAHMLNTMPDYLQHYTQDMKTQVLNSTEQALAWLRYTRIIRDPVFSRARIHFSDIIFGQVDAGDEVDRAQPTYAVREYRSCPWLDQALYINRHGSVSGCARIKNTDKYGFGNVKTDSTESILRRRQELSDRVCCGQVPAACRGCFIAESIDIRLARVMNTRLRRLKSDVSAKFWADRDGDAAGSIKFDPEAIRDVFKFCDGKRTGRDIVHSVAARWRTGPGQTRRRVLPVIAELMRSGAITSQENSSQD